ncbi:hypothetical protein SNE40_001184 [Patella caerulea]|uniref:Sodium-coupled monocarboxylate transporter 1 n=1 Tax=Patella caerulea TaxID=87958 RepID=A0AAN8QHT2_PATCE
MTYAIRGFHYADYIVFVTTIAISIGIGIYYAFAGSKMGTTSEYLVGSRSMKIIPVTLSLMVSFESSIMMLGFPAEVYTHGMMFWFTCFGFGFTMLIGSRLIVPLIHPLKITSVYEYLELRFKSKTVRTIGSSLALLNTVIYMGIVLFGPAIALQAVMGFPLVVSMSVVACASVLYTSIGGFKAVVWTDVFQTFIMLLGIFSVLIKGTIDIGGPSEVFRMGKEGGRLEIWNFDPDPTIRHTFWVLTIGVTLRSFGLAVGQAAIQRISSTPTQKKANWVMGVAGPLFFVTMSLATLEGLIAYAYYRKKGCDPLASGQITNPNQVMPLLVMDIFDSLPGMPGLFMASLFSASLSTLSSGLSACSAQTVEDYILPYMKPKSERTKTILAKLSVVGFGIISVGVSILISTVGGSLSQIGFSLMASFAGPVTGVILLAMLFPFANRKGAIVGVIVSVCFTFWIAAGSYMSPTLMKTPRLPPAPVDNCPVGNFTINPYNYTNIALQKIEDFKHYEPKGLDKLYSVSYLWLGGIAIITVFGIGSIISWCTGCIKPKDTDAKYTIPIFDRFFCCLPECILKPLRCGIDYSKRMSSKLRDNYDVIIQLDTNEAEKKQSTDKINLEHV